MAHARISAKLPPHIDPTKAPIAFGNRALPRLNLELADPELLIRQRALMALCDLLHDPELAYTAVEVGCLQNLKFLLRDEDATVRRKTTEIFYILVTHTIGRFAFLEHDIIVPLSELLNDPEDICRKNMHMAMEMFAQIPAEMLKPASVDRRALKRLSSNGVEFRLGPFGLYGLATRLIESNQFMDWDFLMPYTG